MPENTFQNSYSLIQEGNYKIQDVRFTLHWMSNNLMIKIIAKTQLIRLEQMNGAVAIVSLKNRMN